MPRMPEINADEHLGPGDDVDINTAEPVEKVRRRKKKVDSDSVEIAKEVGSNAFFSEKVDIIVHESTDPAAIPIPQVNVNGVNQFFLRGQKATVKRMFVARLARMKQTRYTQQIVNDPASGNVIQRMVPHVGLRYPFSVIHDPNPKGPAWLQKVLSEA